MERLLKGDHHPTSAVPNFARLCGHARKLCLLRPAIPINLCNVHKSCIDSDNQPAWLGGRYAFDRRWPSFRRLRANRSRATLLLLATTAALAAWSGIGNFTGFAPAKF